MKAKPKTLPACDDKQMIMDPTSWPAWPYLPLKRKNNSLEDGNLGVMLATQEHADAVKGTRPFCIFHVYMFAPPKGKEEWDAAKRTEYANLDALLADGWIVD